MMAHNIVQSMVVSMHIYMMLATLGHSPLLLFLDVSSSFPTLLFNLLYFCHHQEPNNNNMVHTLFSLSLIALCHSTGNKYHQIDLFTFS